MYCNVLRCPMLHFLVASLGRAALRCNYCVMEEGLHAEGNRLGYVQYLGTYLLYVCTVLSCPVLPTGNGAAGCLPVCRSLARPLQQTVSALAR
ncbi:hypothetical protein DM02DRAFT_3001 [Periconia macrospinosa]|uniref:Uncharacterized protein n=1 Tax=Periconia macrospinosa TaxID=97972 RepID=A0A2V1ECU4_9PLEO|nr:hypothetical protein DM02DRAFT_3001 [Periconia macrospinosa]